ncbi:sulfatase-like hydrolase/transferase [Candidatus Poribacteria bacterium]|nr:sulfatase-like hydrolase/transferase [Candidatus Poribacteria bacterium]
MAHTINIKEQENTNSPVTSESKCISRRTFIKDLSIASAGTLALFGSNTGVQSAPIVDEGVKPNILLLMTDQQRRDAMSCSGNWVRTPNLDRIASEGVRFTNCVTTSPVCIPARFSLATGLYPHNTGVWQNGDHTMSPDTHTWMQTLREVGYRTSLFGKTHYYQHQEGIDMRNREHLLHAYGLDDVDEIPGPRASRRVLSHMTAIWQEKGLWAAYRADIEDRLNNKPHVVRPTILGLEHDADVYVGQQAKQYLRNYNRQEPWFCWVSFGGPHEPWDAPEPYASMYDPNAMPPPVPRQPIGNRPRGELDRLMGVNRRNPNFVVGEVERLRADYAGNVTLIDDQIGEILETIQARGELDNTVIVFCSDHGEMNGDYGMIYKSNFLNGSVRIPFLVRTPETLKNGVLNRISESPVEWIDIGPTLVELAGGEIKHQQFGKSLCPVLTNTAETHREFAISEIYRETMLLNQDWKIALNTRREPYLLFDVRNDPDETNNLAGNPDMKKLERELYSQILERLSETQQQMDVEPKGKALVTLGQIKRNELLQNYPNPFNPETWIPFRLADEVKVRIRIWTATGKLVRTLSLGKIPAGDYTSQSQAVHWDGCNEKGESVSSGVYYYSINAGTFSATRKMLIRK